MSQEKVIIRMDLLQEIIKKESVPSDTITQVDWQAIDKLRAQLSEDELQCLLRMEITLLTVM